MDKQRFSSVWDALEDTAEEASHMKLRSQLMLSLTRHITARKLTQSVAARLYGVTQPRISDLMRGKIGLFSLEALIKMATSAGLEVELRISAPALA